MKIPEKKQWTTVIDVIFSKIDSALEYIDDTRIAINDIVDSFLDNHPQFSRKIGPIITRIKSKISNIR